MVTTRREESRTSYYDEQKGSGIALLERKVPASYAEFTQEERNLFFTIFHSILFEKEIELFLDIDE